MAFHFLALLKLAGLAFFGAGWLLPLGVAVHGWIRWESMDASVRAGHLAQNSLPIPVLAQDAFVLAAIWLGAVLIGSAVAVAIARSRRSAGHGRPSESAAG